MSLQHEVNFLNDQQILFVITKRRKSLKILFL